MIEVIEVWMLSALIGLVVSLWGIYQARLDLKFLNGGATAEQKLIGRQRVLAQCFRATITGGWLAAGWVVFDSGTIVRLTPAVLFLISGNILTTLIALSDAIVGQVVRRSSSTHIEGGPK